MESGFFNFGCFDFGIWILESGYGGAVYIVVIVVGATVLPKAGIDLPKGACVATITITITTMLCVCFL